MARRRMRHPALSGSNFADRPYLTAEQLGAVLQVTTHTIRQWTRAGLPCLRLRERLVRYELQPVLAWLTQ